MYEFTNKNGPIDSCLDYHTEKLGEIMVTFGEFATSKGPTHLLCGVTVPCGEDLPFNQKLCLISISHKLCATFSGNENKNYRLPIKVYCRICTHRHIRIEINHESLNVF